MWEQQEKCWEPHTHTPWGDSNSGVRTIFLRRGNQTKYIFNAQTLRMPSSPCPEKCKRWDLRWDLFLSYIARIFSTTAHIHTYTHIGTYIHMYTHTTVFVWELEHKLHALLGMGRERNTTFPNPEALPGSRPCEHSLPLPEKLYCSIKKKSELMRPETDSKGYCTPLPVLRLPYAFWSSVAKYVGFSLPLELLRWTNSFFLLLCVSKDL